MAIRDAISIFRGVKIDFRSRIAVPLVFVSVSVPVFFGIYEVQGWMMPTPLAVFLAAIVLLIILGGVGIVLLEIVRALRKLWEHRSITASWVADEPPGRLDYEFEGPRAANRFNKELIGLNNDTEALGKKMARYTNDAPRMRARAPKKKQRWANSAARDINRSALYIERRANSSAPL